MVKCFEMDDFLKQARKLAYNEVEKTGMPIKLHVGLACGVGKRLAKKLKANAGIVEAGTLLMDCLIGQAIRKEKLEKHVEMSLDKTNELLGQSTLSDKEKENIRHCALEHHGVDKFHSLESEICCNADCYRFASVKGITYAMRFLREMPFKDLIELLEKKFNEKVSVLTLDVCKRELKEEIKLIKSFLVHLKPN